MVHSCERAVAGVKNDTQPGHLLECPYLHQADNAGKVPWSVYALRSHLPRQERYDVMVCLPVSLCQKPHFQTTLTGRVSQTARGNVSQTCPVRARGAAVPHRRSRLAEAPTRARLALPCPAAAVPARPAPLRPQIGGCPRQPTPAPLVSARSRLRRRGSRCSRRPCSPLRGQPRSPQPGSLPVSRGGAVLPPPFPPRLSKKHFFSVVGERKSASSKISEVQVHQIFLLVACYTLRESDCRAPGALLAVWGCSCFPLSRRQKQKWNLLTLSAVPSPVVVAVADLQAL